VTILPSEGPSAMGVLCAKDEGGPLETALQGAISNHRKLQQLRAVVVSGTEKAEQDFVR
jgi:hypothetical protein